MSAPAVGARAPAFTLTDDAGARVSLSSLKGRRAVLFFFPEADTPTCTQQACGFRDEFAAFRELDVVVFGVSADAPDALASFREKFGLPFGLLSDPHHAVSAKYGAYGEKLMYGRKVVGTIRSSVIIDRDGRVAGVFRNVRSAVNGRRMREELARLSA